MSNFLNLIEHSVFWFAHLSLRAARDAFHRRTTIPRGSDRKISEYQTAGGSALSAYVFHRQGAPINRTTFGKQWRRACRKAGIAGRLFHDLRRSAARNMVRAGVPESVAMRVGGWKTAAVFRRYDISDSRDKLDALQRARAYSDATPGPAPVTATDWSKAKTGVPIRGRVYLVEK